MMKSIKLFLILFLTLVACTQKTTQKVTKEEKYLGAKDKIVLFDTLKTVPIYHKNTIANWKSYHKVKQRLEALKKTTPNEVLSVSEDLVKQIALMRDSINENKLQQKGIRARLNGLYNQALRLQEMKSIPAITVSEITSQTQGLFVIFNMINTKINAIDRQIDFDKELVESDFVFSKLDSIQ